VLFPGQSASKTAAYAASPTVQILQNDGNIQAIKETSTNIWAGNFWAAGTVDVVTSGSPSVSIIFRASGSTLTVTVSDPSLEQTQLSITINIAGYHSVVQADSHITVIKLGSAISFTVNVSSQQMAYYTATFSHEARHAMQRLAKRAIQAVLGKGGFVRTSSRRLTRFSARCCVPHGRRKYTIPARSRDPVLGEKSS
jgi:hyaluronate lyase